MMIIVTGFLYESRNVQPIVVRKQPLKIVTATPFPDKGDPSDFYKKEFPLEELTIINTDEVIAYNKLDMFCLAKNIYHEARGEDLLGQLAVAQVTLNRVKSKRYPNDICHVVMQRKQFSWANRKSNRWSHPRGIAWESAKHLATQFLDHGIRVNGLETALYYHADWVNPKWKDADAFVAQIGTHLFYERAKPL